MRTYNDDSANSINAANLPSSGKTLITRFEPFGVRMSVWYDPRGGSLFGSEGGAAGFNVTPLAVQEDCKGVLTATSRLGTTSIPGYEPVFFVDGGILWVPFPAIVALAWPDRDIHNTGVVSYSIESWDSEFNLPGSKGMCYTKYLADAQTVQVNPMVRRVMCSAPNAALVYPDGTVFQTGQDMPNIGGAQSVRMLFLAGMDPLITRAPVTFSYGF